MAFNLDSLKASLGFASTDSPKLSSLDLEGIAKLISEKKVSNIVTMVGAGISTAAGIPDFRSPSTGVYDNLEEFNLADPMQVFTIDYFRKDPRPFFEVARRLYRPKAKPTIAHYFIRLLHEKGILQRHYTQNVDNLERLAGLPEEQLVEAHGSFYTGHCISCRSSYDVNFLKRKIMSKELPTCTKDTCKGVVKPDVVFFGENLPSRFYQLVPKDFDKCDLLIIIGTSLTVLPFCGLLHRVGSKVSRLYINREYSDGSTGTGFFSFVLKFLVAGMKSKPLKWGEANNFRDVFFASDADEGALRLAELLGWKDELLALQKKTDADLEEQNKLEPDYASST